jgi:ArsR family metal-binding transcriptional regulator
MFIIKDYELDLEPPGCQPGAEYWNATARFGYDISAVFPYLNAVWEGALYSPPAQQLACRVEDRAIALKPREITMSNLPDRDTATVELERLIAQINRIWMDRDLLTPRHTARKRLVAMEIYKLLPQTNCKLCGQPSCFAFASQVTIGAAGSEACPPLLNEAQYTQQRQALLEMLAEAAG